MIRTTLLLSLSVFTSGLSAQIAAPSFSIVSNPGPGEDVWVNRNVGYTTSLKMRVTGDVGGWYRVVVGAFDSHPSAPWLNRPAATPAAQYQNWDYQPQFPEPILRYPTLLFQREIDISMFHPLTRLPNPDSARDWYVPLLANTTDPLQTRVWSYDPATWLDPNGGIPGYGEQSAAQWFAMAFGTPVGELTPNVFSVEAMYKVSVIRRAINTPGVGYGKALEYFDDGAYTASFNANRLAFDLGAIYLRSPDLALGTGATADINAVGPIPDQGFPVLPKGLVTKALVVSYFAPLPDVETDISDDLIAKFRPGQWATFSGRHLLAPITLKFPTTAGPVIVTAKSSPTKDNVLRYRVRVPHNIVTGPIVISDYRITGVPVGEVLEVLPLAP